ncbi:hypothetical protein ACFQZE_01270 [Paenibacillus sp. GCM10027627]|uniref:hypothetical protein n=1 Tax=unclassified Paenibacillus TaxID=185978 RepID=UPI00362A7972
MTTTIKRTGGKWAVALLAASTLLFVQPAVQAAPGYLAPQGDGAAEYSLFLKDKHDVDLSGDITKGEYIEAVAGVLNYEPAKDSKASFTDVKAGDELFKPSAALYDKGIIKGPSVQGEGPLTNAVAISIAVRAADLEELAYTYPAAKVNKALQRLGISSSGLGTGVAQELAAAVDTGLLPSNFYSGFKAKGNTSEELAEVLLGKVLETKGLYKNYIGYLTDADLIAKLNQAYATSDVIQAPKLQSLVNEALEQKLITGYNLKDTRYESGFVDSLALTYGHSDLTHAIQLIGLLRSEGLNAKVQFEPKTSAYVHLPEWGDPGPNAVKIKNGNYIVYSKEYDLEFEFFTARDKEAFQDIIFAYAKKNEENQAGLIAGSWWQPLYFSATELKGYKVITNNLIIDPDSTYTVHPFSLNEDSARVVKGLKAIDPNAVIQPYTFWVDVPFFNYLHGESK